MCYYRFAGIVRRAPRRLLCHEFALFETHDPWFSTFIKDAITATGHTYTVFTPANLATVNFSDYRVVILNWDDTPLVDFITPYTAAIPALEGYAGAGGVVWVQAAIASDHPGDNFPMPFGGQGHVRGNPGAPVTLEEFGDFQCPPCGQFAGFAEELLKEYDSRLRVVFRNFPLPGHEHAREAAIAAEAAGFQGKFWEMHDTLYKEQTAWSKAPNTRELFESYAGTLGLNMPS